MTPANEASETAKDLVERLRARKFNASAVLGFISFSDAVLMQQAADEMERLQAALSSAQALGERPMTGILPTMTVEQIAQAFAYDGPINHGDPAFALANVTDSQEARRAGMEEATVTVGDLAGVSRKAPTAAMDEEALTLARKAVNEITNHKDKFGRAMVSIIQAAIIEGMKWREGSTVEIIHIDAAGRIIDVDAEWAGAIRAAAQKEGG